MAKNQCDEKQKCMKPKRRELALSERQLLMLNFIYQRTGWVALDEMVVVLGDYCHFPDPGDYYTVKDQLRRRGYIRSKLIDGQTFYDVTEKGRLAIEQTPVDWSRVDRWLDRFKALAEAWQPTGVA